jgi:hypothetical protein
MIEKTLMPKLKINSMNDRSRTVDKERLDHPHIGPGTYDIQGDINKEYQ